MINYYHMPIKPLFDNTEETINKQSKARNFTVYFLLFAIGLIAFLAVTFTFSFKEKVFQAFFNRPYLFASEKDNSPEVELLVGVNNIYRRGVINIDKNISSIVLKWKVTNNPTACSGRFWSNVRVKDQWIGPKDIKGGQSEIADLSQPGIYVYSINCSNEFGDSSGSSIVINVGAKPTNLQPHITAFQANENENVQYNVKNINQVNLNSKLNLNWSAINTTTQYSICIAGGSWPTIYTNSGNNQVNESFVFDKVKIYKYSVFCSNENGYDQTQITFIVI